VRVPKWVSPEEAELWIAEGLGRKLSKKLVLEALADGLSIEEVSFEETRDEVWNEVKRKYEKMGLI